MCLYFVVQLATYLHGQKRVHIESGLLLWTFEASSPDSYMVAPRTFRALRLTEQTESFLER